MSHPKKIDDASDQPVEQPAGPRYIGFSRPQGSHAAIHSGIEAASNDTIFILDAHMNFWDDDWARRLVDYNRAYPHHVACGICLGLEPDRMAMEAAKGRYYGAYLLLTEAYNHPSLHPVLQRRLLADRWNKSAAVGEIGCIKRH